MDRALRYLLTDITGNSHRSEFCIDKLYNPDALRGRLGLLELRVPSKCLRTPRWRSSSTAGAGTVARFAEVPYSAPLIRWGGSLHEKFLPHFVLADISTVVDDLRAHGIDFDRAWLAPFAELVSRIGITHVGERRATGWSWSYAPRSSRGTCLAMTRRRAPLPAMSTPPRSGFRSVPETSSQLATVACNGSPVPLVAAGTHYVAGVRYKAWKPWSSLHPTLDLDTPLRFDLIDRASQLSLGGATTTLSIPADVRTTPRR